MSASQNMNLLGGIFDFLGGMAQQAQARQQARNIEYMAGINKANFENNAALEVQRMERLAESSVATIESTYAASGVSVSEGSALRVAASEAAAAAGTISNYKRNADVQARMIQYNASLDAFNARAAGASAAIAGTGSLIGSSAQFLKE
tara:strand:+ start:339 stop:782 length:444 start_codon:yes stop_codon:yes gene_type:complete